MIDSYKNIERLRYRINLELNGIKESIDRNSSTWFEEMKIQISSAVISALMAGAITTSEFSSVKGHIISLLSIVIKYNSINSILGWLFSVVFFIILFVLIYEIFDYLANNITKHLKRYKVNRQVKIDYQKEFDNIACDSIFVAIEYRKEYQNSQNTNDNLKTFYFYEIIHYLETACIITRNLCLYKDEYIKLNDKIATGVEIYRIHNMVNLIDELLRFANNQKDIINITPNDKLMVINKIVNIQNIMNNDIKPYSDSL